MNTKSCNLVSFVTCALVCGASYGAETLSVVPDSAEALGIVGGRFANLDDASAVRVSPANIADKTQGEILFNAAVWHGDITFDSVTGSSIKMDEPWVFPASAYVIMPVEPGKVVFGLGVSTPFGLASNYPKDADPSLRYAIAYESRLLAVDITPALAVKASESVSLAVGLDIVYSDLKINQVYPWGMAVPGARDGAVELRGTGWGIGAYAGVNWEITKHQRIALVGRLPIQIDYEGDFTTENMPAALTAAGYTRRSNFESEMEFPGSIAAGYGIDVNDKLTVGFDFQWSANSSHDDIPLNVGNNQTLLPNDRVALGWKDSIDLGTGMSYKLSDQWTLRAGYLYSENSQDDVNYTPAVATYDRHVFSAGIGWKGKRNRVDVAYAFVYNPTREVSGAATPAFNGSYDHQWHVLSFSITHTF